MKRSLSTLFFFMLIVLIAATTGFTQEPEHEEHAEPVSHDAHEQPGEESEHGEHDGEHLGLRNEIVLFLGATDEPGHSTEPTWGFEYIYEFSHRWGIGGFFDYAGGSLRNAVIGVPIVYTPGGRWLVTAAPGMEYHNRRGGSVEHQKADEHGETDENEKHFLFRVGAGYSIAIAEHYSMTPAVYLDFVKGERVWVYGLNFAYKF